MVPISYASQNSNTTWGRLVVVFAVDLPRCSSSPFFPYAPSVTMLIAQTSIHTCQNRYRSHSSPYSLSFAICTHRFVQGLTPMYPYTVSEPLPSDSFSNTHFTVTASISPSLRKIAHAVPQLLIKKSSRSPRRYSVQFDLAWYWMWYHTPQPRFALALKDSWRQSWKL